MSISPWAVLAAGWIVYNTDSHMLMLLMLPILIHELGHMLCLCALGCHVNMISIELSGLCLSYDGDAGRFGQAAAALSGPAAGLIYAWFAARFGACGELSAGMSLLLSAFNLLPALPLDGGRAAEALLSYESVRCLSWCSSVFVVFLGLILFARGKGAALLLAGLFLLTAQFRQGRSSAISPD